MSQVENLFYEVKEYLNMRIELAELKLSHKTSVITSSLITYILLCMIGFGFMLMFTIGLSLWIGSYFREVYWGFLITAGCYLVAGLMLYAVRKRYIKQPVANLILRDIFHPN